MRNPGPLRLNEICRYDGHGRIGVTNSASMPGGDCVEVLLVEDNPVDVAIARMLLDRTGVRYNLHVARDGDDATMFLNRDGPFWDMRTPDLVLIDLKLPKVGGLAVLGEVKRLRSIGRRIASVAILSGSNDPKYQSAASTLGADAYFLKPADPSDYDELARAIGGLLRKSKPASD